MPSALRASKLDTDVKNISIPFLVFSAREGEKDYVGEVLNATDGLLVVIGVPLFLWIFDYFMVGAKEVVSFCGACDGIFVTIEFVELQT